MFFKSTVIYMAVIRNIEVLSDKFNSTKSVLKLCFQYYVFGDTT